MNTAVISTKIDPQTKKEAQKTAEALGMPLSVVIKAFLKHFVRTQTVIFSLKDEISRAYVQDVLKEIKKP